MRLAPYPLHGLFFIMALAAFAPTAHAAPAIVARPGIAAPAPVLPVVAPRTFRWELVCVCRLPNGGRVDRSFVIQSVPNLTPAACADLVAEFAAQESGGAFIAPGPICEARCKPLGVRGSGYDFSCR